MVRTLWRRRRRLSHLGQVMPLGEMAAAELTLIGIVNANATIGTDNFAFVP